MFGLCTSVLEWKYSKLNFFKKSNFLYYLVNIIRTHLKKEFCLYFKNKIQKMKTNLHYGKLLKN